MLAGYLVAGALLSGCARAPASAPAVAVTAVARRAALDGVFEQATSFDELDYDTFLEIDSYPPPIADLYGAGVRNSDGCVPLLAFSGVPSATNPDPFVLSATEVAPGSLGWLAYGFAPSERLLPRGTLRVQRPHLRSPLLASVGSGTCGGSFAFDVNAAIQALPNPIRLVGVQVFTQFVYVDRLGSAQPIGLTNGLRFTIQP